MSLETNERKSLSKAEAGKLLREWCDLQNHQAGKKQIWWSQISPDDEPELFLGIHPETKALIGPEIREGRKYHIIYSSPVRLPFDFGKEGLAAIQVAEIKGTLVNISTLSDIECLIFMPGNNSVRKTIAIKSVFRFFVGDKIQEL